MRRVVVTGLGAVTPVGNDVETMWNSLINGISGVDVITNFDTSDLKVKIAAQVKDFDATKYIEKKEIRKTDLYTQYAVAAAQQAIDDSGIMGAIAEDRFGVYVGAGIGGMHAFTDNVLAMDKGGARKVSPYFVPMMIANIAAGTVAIRFKAKGVCVPIVTACATGSHSIGEAFHAIKNGYADAIIAGGAEAAVTPLSIAGFSNCKALTTNPDPKTASVPFDKRRDGFVIGEGAGILILEEYEHAKARGAKIYAEICGYGNTCDAHHITAPDPEAEGPSRAIKLAFEEAQVTDSDVIYINAHGTSTPLNDKTETKAIKLALGEERAREINISSTKSMTGHMLGAAGGVEGVVAALAIKEGIIPPTIGYEVPDEECDLNYTPNKAEKKDITVAASTSLGFGGHNACIVFRKVEEQ
ncbi:beta-ketoacyl-[acyl-carrier-protein] synthase II [Anaeromassilibacillus sp. An172]|uniref:beta-ketoacyl-ACP synthase II n=1 Tax=Anaeromassilibacillus sp. An172 TaxID=1965570 RepID=UPI000B38A67A|nr:beta-ketoacyl-ACP synthase II [Anaeromassilibacillus sp. An172]OUP77420.1 beta-ketoacyl-[acyl-carrier-protein] synthase II [Anaeromassilibacillus sp. An172]